MIALVKKYLNYCEISMNSISFFFEKLNFSVHNKDLMKTGKQVSVLMNNAFLNFFLSICRNHGMQFQPFHFFVFARVIGHKLLNIFTSALLINAKHKKNRNY